MPKGDNVTTNSGGVQSLQRGIAVLRAVAKSNEHGSTLSSIAAELNLNVSTTHRMLRLLVAEGLLSFDNNTKLYKLGMDLFLMAGTAQQFTFRDRFRPALERIALEAEDMVALLVRTGYDSICLDRVEGKYPIRAITIEIGTRRPLGIGAGSLSLVAFLPEEDLEAVLRANEPRYPQFRNLTSADIKSIAETSRSRGYVLSDGVFHRGIASVGVPICEDGQVLAAISVSAIQERMDPDRVGRIVKLIRDSAEVYL